MILIEVPGRMVGKGRPRIVRNGDQIRAMTPEKTRNMEAVIRQHAADAMDGRPPFLGAVEVIITMRWLYPRSWSKRRRGDTHWATGRPDLDNCLKLLGDALNKIVWHDDAQIASIGIARYYVDDVESTTIRINELGKTRAPWMNKALDCGEKSAGLLDL